MKFVKVWCLEVWYFILFGSGYYGKIYGSFSLMFNFEYQDVFCLLVFGVFILFYGDFDVLKVLVCCVGLDKIIVVVVELIQGEGGVNILLFGFLCGLGEFCCLYGIVVIVDEIQIGLGCIGYWFELVVQGFDVDIIIFVKLFGGGLVLVGVIIVWQFIYKKMFGGLSSKCYFNIFGGGVLSMVVGLKLFEYLFENDLFVCSCVLGEQGLVCLQDLQWCFFKLLQVVCGQGLLLVMQFQLVVGLVLLGVICELVYEGIVILVLCELYYVCVMVNFSFSSKWVVCFFFVFDMLQDVFIELMDWVECFVQFNFNVCSLVMYMFVFMLLWLVIFVVSKFKKCMLSDG